MPKQRGQGEGAIYFSEARQRWIGLVDAGRGPDGRRRRIKLSARTRADLRRKLAATQKEIEAGLTTTDQRTTVAEFAEYWLAHGLPGSVTSPNTIDNLTWAVRHHIVPAIGARRLRDLTADDVDRLLRRMVDRGMSRSSLIRVHSTLARLLRYAERRGKVARNVATLVDVPAAPTGRGRSLTVTQAKAVLNAARGDRLEALYVTGLLLGLRPGELLGLKWDAIDFVSATLAVRTALKRERGQLLIGEPKTLRSRRRLDLPHVVVQTLIEHRERQCKERSAAGAAWTETGLVFTTSTGTPIDPSNLRRAFAKLANAAGLGHWHPHELRHSAASLLSAAGVPIEQISDVLGHAGPRTTAAVYRHLVSPSVNAGKQPMEMMFAGDIAHGAERGWLPDH